MPKWERPATSTINRGDRWELWSSMSGSQIADNYCLRDGCGHNNISYRDTCVRCGSLTEHGDVNPHYDKRPGGVSLPAD